MAYEDTNPITGVSFADDRFVIFNPATSQIETFSAKWTRLDGGPHQGPFPGGKKYYKRQRPNDVPVPDFDHRYAVTTTSVMQDTSPYIEGHPHGNYVTLIQGNLRTAEELKAQVDTVYVEANTSLYPPGLDPMRAHQVNMALARRAAGTADPQDAEILAEADAIYDKSKQNMVRRDELYAAIDAGLDYDATTGFNYGSSSALSG